MRFLITNDDGIDAPGIAALYESICYYARQQKIAAQIWVVAPDRGRSECSHSVTTVRDLELREIRTGWYSVDGTPVDCVRVALACLCPHVDAVFSGINAGANVGIDLLVSGTFAAAREAAILGKPSMAISHYRRPDVPKTWDHAPRWLESTLVDFLASMPAEGESLNMYQGPSTDNNRPAESERDGHGSSKLLPANEDLRVWNVNLPALDPALHAQPEKAFCPVDQTPMRRTGRLNEASFPTHSVNEPPPSTAPERNSELSTLSVAGKPQAGPFEGPVSTRVQLASDFHGRSRTPGSDVDRCFSGCLTISKIHPKLAR